MTTTNDQHDSSEDGLVVSVYARITGGGYRGAIAVRRVQDNNPLELACELPRIFSDAESACAAAAIFAAHARASGVLLSLLQDWDIAAT